MGGFFPTTILWILCRLGDHIGSVILRLSKGSFSHSSEASKNRTVVLFGSCGSSIPIGRLYFTDGLEYIRLSFVASLGLIHYSFQLAGLEYHSYYQQFFLQIVRILYSACQ